MEKNKSCFSPVFGRGLCFKKKGFTLIEILVVVLIIGILGAIALPQYQRALLKSRYAALMPIAKSMANSNEAYYLEHGNYADNPQDLPVQGRQNYPDGTELEFGTSTDYAYVLASNPSVEHNTYVVYQKHSKNFPDNIHCEALTEDTQANQVCQSFGGTPIDGSLGGEEYTAYLLSGNGNGTFEKECKTTPETEQACASGCGIGTREAECDTRTGEWIYAEELTGCTEKPASSQSCSVNNKSGTQTRSVTCNSEGTAWETGSWSSCNIPCEGEQPANISARESTATGTATCVNGEWVYEWTGGKTYSAYQGSCATYGSTNTYGCAGSTFSGEYSLCRGESDKGCVNSTFSGYSSHCRGEGANTCANSTFSGEESYCEADSSAYKCTGSTFSGKKSFCRGQSTNACAGTIIQAGAYCIPEGSGGCNGALYGAHPDKDPNLIGSCFDYSGYCPTGVPVFTDYSTAWKATNGSFDYTWKGNCCNPAYMVSGTCPSGVAVCS